MNDLINRQMAIGEIKKCRFVVDAIEKIKALPSVQTEIIRCRDCKHARLTSDGSCKYCDIWFPDESRVYGRNEAEYMDGDYYCASAERRTDG